MTPVFDPNVVTTTSPVLANAILFGFIGLVAVSCGLLFWLWRDPGTRDLVKR